MTVVLILGLVIILIGSCAIGLGTNYMVGCGMWIITSVLYLASLLKG